MDEGDGLENHCGFRLTEGSNPSPSARRLINNSSNNLFERTGIGEVPEWTIGAAC